MSVEGSQLAQHVGSYPFRSAGYGLEAFSDAVPLYCLRTTLISSSTSSISSFDFSRLADQVSLRFGEVRKIFVQESPCRRQLLELVLHKRSACARRCSICAPLERHGTLRSHPSTSSVPLETWDCDMAQVLRFKPWRSDFRFVLRSETFDVADGFAECRDQLIAESGELLFGFLVCHADVSFSASAFRVAAKTSSVWSSTSRSRRARSWCPHAPS